MKKFLPISLIIIMIFNLIATEKTQAAAPVFARVVAGSVGEKAIISMMERQGVKFASKKARERAVEKWNLELYKKIQEANKYGDELKAAELARFQKSFTDLTPSSVKPLTGNKVGFGEIAVSSVLFLTGADIILDIANEIKLAQATEEYMDRMVDIENGILSGDLISSYGAFSLFTKPSSLGLTWYFGTEKYFNEIGDQRETYKKFIIFVKNIRIQKDYTQTENRITFTRKVTYINPFGNLVDSEYDYKFSYPKSLPFDDMAIVKNIPQIDEVPEITPVQIPETLPEAIPIIIPIQDISQPFPWNDPISDLDPVGDKDTSKDPNKDRDPNLPPEGPPNNPEDPDGKKINWKPLLVALSNLRNVFPFSIPWDMGNFLSRFDVKPIAPKFEISIDKTVSVANSNIPFKMDWDLDFKIFNVVATAIRWLQIIAFDFFLITALRKYTPD